MHASHHKTKFSQLVFSAVRKNMATSTLTCWHGARLLVILVCLWLSAWPSVVPASPGTVTKEYHIKAAYLYKFLLFVKWPEGPSRLEHKSTIAIIGDSPFNNAFEAIQNKPIGPYKSVIEVINPETAQVLKSTLESKYRIVFIVNSQDTSYDEALKALEGAPILTVGEDKGFLSAGGMINLIVQGNVVRWEINRTALKESGLQVHSQLLRNAVRVISE
jgi:hypothetical protein